MLDIGSELAGTYRITRLLGQGGMACVYEVTHARLPTRMAAKVITGELGRDPKFLQRFRQEAEILALLRHPHVVHVSDWNVTAQGQPYLVMELLEGEDLSQRIKRTGAIPVEEALPIFLQVGDALQAAHDQGVVHRDLKPGNIFLLSKGAFRNYVKVLDFGIAKDINARSGPRTKKAEILGTPAYMAPEQVRGTNSIGVGADQFALALVLYEMLAGRSAFYVPGEDMLQTLARVLLEEPPPLTQHPQLDAVLRRALNKDPVARFPSIREFVAATGAMDLSVVKPLLAHTRPMPLITAQPLRDVSAIPGFTDPDTDDFDAPEAPDEKDTEKSASPPAALLGATLQEGGASAGVPAVPQRTTGSAAQLRSASQSRPSITGQKVDPFKAPRRSRAREVALLGLPLLAAGGAALLLIWGLEGGQEHQVAEARPCPSSAGLSCSVLEDAGVLFVLADARGGGPIRSADSGLDDRADAGVHDSGLIGRASDAGVGADAGMSDAAKKSPPAHPETSAPKARIQGPVRGTPVVPPRPRPRPARITRATRTSPAAQPITLIVSGSDGLGDLQKDSVLRCANLHIPVALRAALITKPLALNRTGGGALIITSEPQPSYAEGLERCLGQMAQQMSVPSRVSIAACHGNAKGETNEKCGE